jgi:heme/copper-type cytochrome/quinol oxidase subunit 3
MTQTASRSSSLSFSFCFWKKSAKFQSEKQNENELKKKSAVTFVTALFFLVAGSIELSNLIRGGLEQIESIY